MSATPDPVVYFIDRSLGRRFANALHEAGYRIERHDDHFPQTTPDVEWMKAVATRGWVVLTQDDRIYRNPVERAVAEQTGTALCILTGGSEPVATVIGGFLATIGALDRFVRRQERPFVASVGRSSRPGEPGRITLRTRTPGGAESRPGL